MDMLLEQFKVLFDRPEKVKKLRELILQLAVRGKLVEQDENDEHSAVLLERIREEKERLVGEGKLKKNSIVDTISEELKSYSIPTCWEWARLDDIVELNDNSVRRGPFGSAIRKDMFVPKGENTFKVYEQKNAIQKDWKLGEYYINEEMYNDLKRFSVHEGDIIISCAGTIGETYILPKGIEKGIINQALLKIHLNNSVIENYYFIYLFKALTQEQINNSAKGSAMKNLSSIDYLKNNVVFPLPPINEQKRILDRIDFLMHFCENLEKELERKVKYSSLSSKSVFNSVGNCSSAEELEETLRFIIENFKDLTLGDGAVNELRNTILQLAVQGKLVQQDQSDEPASVLLEKINEEKERLISEGKIKKEKPLPEIGDDEKPYELPKSWEWARLSEIGELARGKSKHRPRNDDILFREGKYPLVQTGDVARADKIIRFYNSMYSEYGLKQSRLWKKGTLCITIAANIADSAILGFDACFPDSVVGFVPYAPIGKDMNDYFYYLINVLKSDLEKYAPATAQKNINLEILNTVLVPLPPFNELSRIIEKANNLVKMCNELEKRIEKSKKYSERLLEALLKEAFKA